MKHTILLAMFVLVGCGKNSDSAPQSEPVDEKLVRHVDANCGLIDVCAGLELMSEDMEFRCLREKVSSGGWINPWPGVDFGDNACFTTYRLQQKDPTCDPEAPNKMCSGLFGSFPCCKYDDVEGAALEDILPVKAECSGPKSCN